jgi:hypothetical protein
MTHWRSDKMLRRKKHVHGADTQPRHDPAPESLLSKSK